MNTDFPSAKIKKQATLSLIWLVPVIVAIVAAWLVVENFQKIGPTITIQFDDGSGIQPNQTVLRYRGVRVGSVRSVELSKDTQRVEVRARLNRSAAGLAREGTIFWVVRPEVGAGGFHALETIVSGPYIQAQPGNGGKKQKNFIGANEPPVITPVNDGAEFILRSANVTSLSPGSPVYYRGLEAGSVQFLGLSENSDAVDVHVLIKKNFSQLIRTNTVFWNAGGINVNLHFFGINMSAENLKSLVVGGIAFATPPDAGPRAKAGTLFPLRDKPEDKWLEWTPGITITNAKIVAPASTTESPSINNLNN